MSRYFEDIQVGDSVELGSHSFDAAGIKAFAMRFDPQRFHVDEVAATRSHFGALCASGWHTAVVAMRLLVEHRDHVADAMRARGETPAAVGPSPGFRQLKWLQPVYAGDTVIYATTVVEMRPSASRAAWGLISNSVTGTNQNGQPVISFVGTGFVEMRKRA